LQADLQRAGNYLRSLLPPPMRAGPVQTNWVYEPAALLCGDAFGVHPVDPDHLAFFLIDVSGHGAGAALHTATAINALRHRLLPGVDFREPAQVLTALNRTYPMERHGNVYFSIWYGVFCQSRRTLRFASAGHPPALLKSPGGEVLRLHTQRVAIGLVPDEVYDHKQVNVPAGSRLFIFSDGVYEVETPGVSWSFNDFRDEVARLPSTVNPESDYLHARVVQVAGTRDLQDDFTLLVARFE
jgi:phosphoserine phosphatase RsbU/P